MLGVKGVLILFEHQRLRQAGTIGHDGCDVNRLALGVEGHHGRRRSGR